MRIELKNEAIWVDEIEGTFRTWSDDTYEVTVQEFDRFAYIVRLDVEEPYRGKGLGTAIVQALRDKYRKVIAAPEGERSRGFFARIGGKDLLGELMGQTIWPLDQGYGIYIME